MMNQVHETAFTVLIFVFLTANQNIKASPCEGTAEIIRLNTLPDGYSPSTEGDIEPGYPITEVDLVSRGTASVTITNDRSDVSVTFGNMSFTMENAKRVTLRFHLSDNSFYEVDLVEPNSAFNSADPDSVSIESQTSDLETLLTPDLFVQYLRITVVANEGVSATMKGLFIALCVPPDTTIAPTTLLSTLPPSTLPPSTLPASTLPPTTILLSSTLAPTTKIATTIITRFTDATKITTRGPTTRPTTILTRGPETTFPTTINGTESSRSTLLTQPSTVLSTTQPSTASTTASTTSSSTTSSTKQTTSTTKAPTTQPTSPTTTLEPTQDLQFKTDNTFPGSNIEKGWLNNTAAFKYDFRLFMRSLAISGNRLLEGLPLTRFELLDVYEGSTVFVTRLKPGASPANDPPIDELTAVLCNVIDAGNPFDFLTGGEIITLYPQDGSCIKNFNYTTTTTSTTTESTTQTTSTTASTSTTTTTSTPTTTTTLVTPDAGGSTSDDDTMNILIYILVAVVSVLIIVIIAIVIYYCCCRRDEWKAEKRVAPAKSDVQARYSEEGAVPYPHSRQEQSPEDPPDRGFLRREEFYTDDGDVYLPPAPRPPRGKSQGQWSQPDEDGYSYPPDSDRHVLVDKSQPVSRPKIHKRRDPSKSRSSGDGSSYTNKTYASPEESDENLYQTVEMKSLPHPDYQNSRMKQGSKPNDYSIGPIAEHSAPRKDQVYPNNRYENVDESKGVTRGPRDDKVKTLPPSKSPRLLRSKDFRDEATVPIVQTWNQSPSGLRIYIDSDESDLNQTHRY